MTPYSPEGDERVMTLVELALNTPVVEREACLRAACGGDGKRTQWEERMGGFLLEPLVPRIELDHAFTARQFRFRKVRGGLKLAELSQVPRCTSRSGRQ